VKVSERRMALLEKKAEQADQAKGIMADASTSEAEKQARMRELFGIS
jgi:hypothetical protein